MQIGQFMDNQNISPPWFTVNDIQLAHAWYHTHMYNYLYSAYSEYYIREYVVHTEE